MGQVTGWSGVAIWSAVAAPDGPEPELVGALAQASRNALRTGTEMPSSAALRSRARRSIEGPVLPSPARAIAPPLDRLAASIPPSHELNSQSIAAHDLCQQVCPGCVRQQTVRRRPRA